MIIIVIIILYSIALVSSLRTRNYVLRMRLAHSSEMFQLG